MKLRIVRIISKETGLTLRFRLERRTFPFVWTKLEEYSAAEGVWPKIEHDIMFFLNINGLIKHTMEHV